MSAAAASTTFADWTIWAGRRVRRDLAEAMRSALGGGDFSRHAMRLLLTTTEASAAGAALLAPDEETRAAWRELQHKLEAFRAFEHVDALLGVAVDGAAPVDLVERAARLGPPLSVWAAEGIGYHATARCLDLSMPDAWHPRANAALPAWALIPVYAGIGSALAAQVLARTGSDASPARLEQNVAWFQDACAAHADPEHCDVAIEALGFVAQGMFGERLPDVAAAVRNIRPPLARLFWHGVGRASYFAPSAALPLAATRRRALGEVVNATCSQDERANAVAGFAWAATLVNLGDAIVLESLARDARRLGISDAFTRGSDDAVEIWSRCAPDDPTLARFSGRRSEARRCLAAGTLFQIGPEGA